MLAPLETVGGICLQAMPYLIAQRHPLVLIEWFFEDDAQHASSALGLKWTLH